MPTSADTDGATLTILFAGSRYRVLQLRCSMVKSAVICFDYWVSGQADDRSFAAEGFFRHRGINAIGIVAAENDWFQHPEIDAALAAIRAATMGFQLIGYGGSMGAYGAINFADYLGLRSVIAICPQFSIDGARAPYEPRWRGDAQRIETQSGFARDRIDEVRPPVRGWLIYDPLCIDARHAADIQRHHAFTEMKLFFGSHDQMLMLSEAQMLGEMLVEMIAGVFDMARFRRGWRRQRRQSARYWLGLAAALTARGNARGALRALNETRALTAQGGAAIDLAEAKARLALGEHGAVAALAGPWAGEPGWTGETAAWLLGQI